MLLQGQNTLFRSTFFRYIWILLMFRDNNHNKLRCSSRGDNRWLLERCLTISQCLNLGSLRHDSRCSATIHHNEKMWVQEQVTTIPGNISPEERSNMSKRFTAQSHTEVGRRTNTIGSCEREQRGIHSIPGDPDYEEIVKIAIRKLEIPRASAMPGKVNHTSQPERFKHETTLCKWLVKSGHEKVALFIFQERSWGDKWNTAKDSNKKEYRKHSSRRLCFHVALQHGS